ncbi:hypothetical protein SHJG_8447 [Streptomyces hygroscopicus subsp. jinggangensis 5008]|nr:hypothetical protein SHJG_8447 [Streptomyces hygroscopicus subsp. jinggangensis 5008]AGF67870.1 hypothetical protein SHJGH_8208 [Streptomyces hygroscopicus subsp. jinggangensis TL01]
MTVRDITERRQLEAERAGRYEQQRRISCTLQHSLMLDTFVGDLTDQLVTCVRGDDPAAAPQAAVALYTDGLVERPGTDIEVRIEERSHRSGHPGRDRGPPRRQPRPW